MLGDKGNATLPSPLSHPIPNTYEYPLIWCCSYNDEVDGYCQKNRLDEQPTRHTMASRSAVAPPQQETNTPPLPGLASLTHAHGTLHVHRSPGADSMANGGSLKEEQQPPQIGSAEGQVRVVQQHCSSLPGDLSTLSEQSQKFITPPKQVVAIRPRALFSCIPPKMGASDVIENVLYMPRGKALPTKKSVIDAVFFGGAIGWRLGGLEEDGRRGGGWRLFGSWLVRTSGNTEASMHQRVGPMLSAP